MLQAEIRPRLKDLLWLVLGKNINSPSLLVWELTLCFGPETNSQPIPGSNNWFLFSTLCLSLDPKIPHTIHSYRNRDNHILHQSRGMWLNNGYLLTEFLVFWVLRMFTCRWKNEAMHNYLKNHCNVLLVLIIRRNVLDQHLNVLFSEQWPAFKCPFSG